LGLRRRLATQEEAAQVWPYVERQLKSAAPHELRPLYELYQELTSESFYGPHGEPYVSLVLDAIRVALWSNKLHFEFQAPFDPLLEPEWEPPALDKLHKYLPPQSPSEIWGRKNIDTFIGIRLKDQTGKLLVGSRIRVKLPDGTTKEGTTNTDGELEIKGFTQDGNADITFLDDCKPGKAEAPEWPEEKEFKATVVDEIGNPISGVWLYFRHGNASNLVLTDGSGVATYKTSAADSVSVSFESADALAQVMSSIWTETLLSEFSTWIKPEQGTTAVALLKGSQLQQLLPSVTNNDSDNSDESTDGGVAPEQLRHFDALSIAAGNSLQISVQPHTDPKLRIRLLDLGGTPIRGTLCQLSIDGTESEVWTDSEGILEAEVPFTAKSGTLIAEGIHYELAIGALAAISDSSGIDDRLKNLGLYAPGGAALPGNGSDPEKMLALELIQARERMKIDGQLTDATVQAIQNAYGC
jgi:hypothetical protein